MKKTIIGLILAVCVAVPSFLLVGCGRMVTPIAYVEFVAENEQVVVYTSHMHIFLFMILLLIFQMQMTLNSQLTIGGLARKIAHCIFLLRGIWEKTL